MELKDLKINDIIIEESDLILIPMTIVYIGAKLIVYVEESGFEGTISFDNLYRYKKYTEKEWLWVLEHSDGADKVLISEFRLTEKEAQNVAQGVIIKIPWTEKERK